MEKKAPLVSILMPCYNSEKYLVEAISSIIEQTYSNWELLICDDSSTDKSLSIIKQFESDKIKIFEKKINKGYLKTCNFLFKQAKGDYITFQDSDDYSSLDRIELILKEFRKNPKLGACGTQFNFMTDSGVKLVDSSPVYPLKHNDIIKSFMDEAGFCGASVMVTKKVIQDIGTYHEYWDRIGSEDIYWLYLIAEKYEIANIKETSYFYRHNPNSVTRNKTNPRKIHCHDFLTFFISQRINTNSDFLEQKNINGIKEMEKKITQQYIDEPNLLYFRLADWAYTDNKKQEVFQQLFKALKNRPSSLYTYRTIWSYFKKIYLKSL